MIHEAHIESPFDRDRHRHELARRILGIGLLAAVGCGALALLRRRKTIFLRPLMSFVFLLLVLALLGTCLKALRSRHSG
jgi:hypothetical protein